MIVKGHEGHVTSVSTAFKVHYNQKLGDPFNQFGGRTMASGGIVAPDPNYFAYLINALPL